MIRASYVVHFLRSKEKYKMLSGIFCKLIELWLKCYTKAYKTSMVWV